MPTYLQRRIATESISPFRTPDWRWLLILSMFEQGRRSTSKDDPALRQALGFARAHIRAQVEGSADRARHVQARWPELSRAYAIYQENGTVSSEIEARLLAGEAWEVIAARTGEATAVLQAYELLFFNVADALEALDWIIADIILAGCPGREPTQAQCWKYLAISGGAIILDLVIADELQRREPAFEDRPLLAKMARTIAREFFIPRDASTSYQWAREVTTLARQLNLERSESTDRIVEILRLVARGERRAAGRRRRGRASYRRPAPSNTAGSPIPESILVMDQLVKSLSSAVSPAAPELFAAQATQVTPVSPAAPASPAAVSSAAQSSPAASTPPQPVNTGADGQSAPAILPPQTPHLHRPRAA